MSQTSPRQMAAASQHYGKASILPQHLNNKNRSKLARSHYNQSSQKEASTQIEHYGPHDNQ